MARPPPRVLKNKGIWIRRRNPYYEFGQTVYLPGGRFGPRLQRGYQLVVLVSGSLRVVVDGGTHEVAPGEAILQHPGGNEDYWFSAEAETTHTWCQVTPGQLFPEDRRLLQHVRGVHRVSNGVQALIREGLAEQGAETKLLDAAGAALARACLLRFAADVVGEGIFDSKSRLHPALQRAVMIAQREFAELTSAVELARRAGISPSRLRALCQAQLQESPAALVRRLKAEQAIQLIRSTGLTLGEIAEACGYANPFHLSRSVRRQAGQSPRALRMGAWRATSSRGPRAGPKNPPSPSAGRRDQAS